MSASQIHQPSSELELIIGPIALHFSGFEDALPVAVRETFTPWQKALPDVTIVHRASISLGNTRQRHFSLEIEDHHLDVARHTSAWQLARPATDSPDDWIRWIDCATRTVCQAAIAQIGGELLHGATLEIWGMAWIVLGQSGRGKSTIFEILGGYDEGHLHDDKVIVWDNRAWSLPAESSKTHPAQVVPKAVKHGGYLTLGERESPATMKPITAQMLRVGLSCALVETKHGASEDRRLDWILNESTKLSFEISYDASIGGASTDVRNLVASTLEKHPRP